MYKLTKNSVVIRLFEGASIPADPQNADYAAYLDWVTAGNTPTPADLPVPPTALEQIRALEQAHDDDQRKLGRLSALSVYLDTACSDPEMAGKTRDEVHDICYATIRSYRELHTLESQVSELRKQIVKVAP